MSESLKRSLAKGAKALLHDVGTAVLTAAGYAACTWLLTPGNMEDILGNSAAALGIWLIMKPALVAMLDQRKHGGGK